MISTSSRARCAGGASVTDAPAVDPAADRWGRRAPNRLEALRGARKQRRSRALHKSSRYWDDELRGFRDGLKGIPHVDLLALEKRRTQFFRRGDYPPLRGTWIQFDETDYLLYTRGFIPFLRTYPGMRVPQPLEMVEHHGDSPVDELLREIMALTKMNWNSADFAAEEPMTLAFARKVGEILGEMPPGMIPQPEYRYYM